MTAVHHIADRTGQLVEINHRTRRSADVALKAWDEDRRPFARRGRPYQIVTQP